jgi:very-short-patch-repair endonuclease
MKTRIGTSANDPAVLVGVIKDRRDLGILLRDRWYRIPVKHSPARKFGYLAFYQPQAFGRRGGTIRYVAPVLGRTIARRRDLLPAEPDHARADDKYWCYRVGKPLRLPKPVPNLAPRRVTFAFTTLRRLFESHDILDVFGVPPIERMLKDELAKAGIRAFPEFTVSLEPGRRYRLDFAVFCARGPLAIECDGAEFHSIPAQRRRDRTRDRRLKKAGWTVVRLKEEEIVRNASACARRVTGICRRMGNVVTGDPASNHQ